ncbi:MAG: FAD-binding oxidoreductase, partial [Candidatus Rokubacteria bacterium]|nr:FAD-binding oxidoreductase [Candidatus Rokubacteria bacterium]
MPGRAMSDLERELRAAVRGDVRFDPASRLLYATDASMYQVEPIGVVQPRDADDVDAVLEVARRRGVALLPRGGGTSLTGQAVNEALVLDFSRWMNRVLEVQPEEGWARVQPGVVQDELNHHVRPGGLLFGPDTSTSNRATLGGMLGNNSGGAHSIVYGLTVDHVLDLTVRLADGTRLVLGVLTEDEFRRKMAAPDPEGRIYRAVARLRDEYADEIRARYPAYWRRVAGYNLNELVGVGVKPGSWAGGDGRPRPLSLARLVVGSEGTLCTIVEARVRLVPRPKHTALSVIHYRDLQEALESSQAILETGPYAVELTDKMILDLARDNIEQRRRMGFIQGDPAAILIVEYAGESEAEVRAKIEALEARRARERFGYAAHLAFDPAEQQSIWKLRKAGLGLLLGMKGDGKPIAFVEDTAVEPRHLPKFIPRFREIFARHGVDGAYYGHCSVGCLHIRPVINLKTRRGIEQASAA